MEDPTSLVALIVAVIALGVSLSQLIQQLLATGYTIRKCDSLVTGGLTKPAKRQWHWGQCRFTVKYETVVFTLPIGVYRCLDIHPAVSVSEDRNHLAIERLFRSALDTRTKRTPTQACWVSHLQDLMLCGCLDKRNVSIREENGDRIPEDLTVAPARVDAMTILLTSLVMGMQVHKYSPTTGGLSLSGRLGSISSSDHPVLGTVVHYSPASFNTDFKWEDAKVHARALHHEEGIWARTVFGQFRDRTFRSDFRSLEDQRRRFTKLIEKHGWPDETVDPEGGGLPNGLQDGSGGAECFMVFAGVDCYLAVPASAIRGWCAHFSEMIVLHHHWEIVQGLLRGELTDPTSLPDRFLEQRSQFVNSYGASSPSLPWQTIPFLGSSKLGNNLLEETEIWSSDTAYNKLLAGKELIAILQPWINEYGQDMEKLSKNCIDPSEYITLTVAWEMILRLDQIESHLRNTAPANKNYLALSNDIMARAVCRLPWCGPPSWAAENFFSSFLGWRQTFNTCCELVVTEAFGKTPAPDGLAFIRTYTYIRMLRASYFTVMMRMEGWPGPGLVENQTQIETALLHMA